MPHDRQALADPARGEDLGKQVAQGLAARRPPSNSDPADSSICNRCCRTGSAGRPAARSSAWCRPPPFRPRSPAHQLRHQLFQLFQLCQLFQLGQPQPPHGRPQPQPPLRHQLPQARRRLSLPRVAACRPATVETASRIAASRSETRASSEPPAAARPPGPGWPRPVPSSPAAATRRPPRPAPFPTGFPDISAAATSEPPHHRRSGRPHGHLNFTCRLATRPQIYARTAHSRQTRRRQTALAHRKRYQLRQ